MNASLFRLLALCSLVLWGSVAAQAISWTPGWMIPVVGDERPVLEAERIEARRLGDLIDSAASARLAIQAWEKIAAAQPTDPEAWIEIACLRVLEGAAYRQRSKERLVCYVAGLQACERAMATNPEFLRRIREGESTWAAAAALGPREIGAMNLWSTGVFYIFRDCLGFFGRIANVKKMNCAKAMLLHMDALDPTWENYTSTFSWGIYYLAMPSSQGGNKARARECFDRAVALGGQRALPRWGRGKYFYTAVGEHSAARADLEAVAARDLASISGHRSWNRYFQAEAVRLLAGR